MTSEQNITANDKYLNLQNNENNSGPKRIPTEGEIDQFIELLKHSNTTGSSNLEGNKQNLKSDSNFSNYRKSNSDNKVSSEISSCVTLKEDGTLMKTIHVQSPNSYLREAERFDPELHHDLRDMERDSISPYSQSSDYLRKTTYSNNQSELKVTLSRDQHRSYSYHNRYNDREDNDRGYNKDVIMHSKTTSNEPHSRSYGFNHETERYSHELGSSSSYGRYNSGSASHDIDLRMLQSVSPQLNSQRSTYTGEYRQPRGNSSSPPPPPIYSNRTSMRLRASSPSYSRNSSYYGSGSHHIESNRTRDIPHSSRSRSQWSRSPSPIRSSRISHTSRGKRLYSPFNEDNLSDFEMHAMSPDIKIKRGDSKRRLEGRRRSPSLPIGGVPSPPSPPPPPILSDLKRKSKKGENYITDYERSRLNKIGEKDSVNPISTLLADRNVSISTLLEAAIGSSAGGKNSSSYSAWDSTKKAEILANCEEKIGQLYLHRVSGPGSFIPDAVPQPEKPYIYKSPLLMKHPRFEFNSRPIGNIWNCPKIIIPDPKTYKYYSLNNGDEDEDGNGVVCITDDDEMLASCGTSKSKVKSNKNKEDDYKKRKADNVQQIKTIVSFGSKWAKMSSSNNDSSIAKVDNNQVKPRVNTVSNNIYIDPCSMPNQEYSAEPQYTSPSTSYNVPPDFQQPPFLAASSSSYDTNIWMNSGVPYQQSSAFENQLVQYPIGHQPVEPSVPFGINNDYQMMAGPYSPGIAQYPSPLMRQDMNLYPAPGLPTPADGWFQQDKPNKSSLEKVQYPLKHRSNSDHSKSSSHNSNSKCSSHNSNLISLTDSSRSERTESSKTSSVFNTEEDIVKEDMIDDGIPLDLDRIKIDKLKVYSTLIRNIQVNDDKTRDIIKDLESGPKIYSYAYLVWHRILLKKDENKYKIYVSELCENSLISVFHEIFHDMRETELIEIAKKVLPVMPALQESVAHAFRLCPFCKKGATNDENRESMRGKSPNKSIPFVQMCSPKKSYDRPSRNAPLKRRRSYNKSPSPKKIAVSPSGMRRTRSSISKERSDRTRSSVKNRSPSPRNLNLTQNKRYRSRSNDRRDRRQGRSANRRTPSADRSRRLSKGRSGRSPYNRYDYKRSKKSSDVEIVDHIKNIDTIDLTEESLNETMGMFIIKSEVTVESEVMNEKENPDQSKVKGSNDASDVKKNTGEASKSQKISIKFKKDMVNDLSKLLPTQKDDTISKEQQEKDKVEVSDNERKHSPKEVEGNEEKSEKGESLFESGKGTGTDDDTNQKEDKVLKEGETFTADGKDLKKEEKRRADKDSKGEERHLLESDKELKGKEKKCDKKDKESSSLKEGGTNLKEEGNRRLKEEKIVAKQITTKNVGKSVKKEVNVVKEDDKEAKEKSLKKERKITREEKSQETSKKKNTVEGVEKVKEDISKIKKQGKEIDRAVSKDKQAEINQQKEKTGHTKESGGHKKKEESANVKTKEKVSKVDGDGQSKKVGASAETTKKDKQSVKKDDKTSDKKKEDTNKVPPSTAPGQSKKVGASAETTTKDKQSVKKDDKAPGKKKEKSDIVLPSTAPGQSKEVSASTEKTPRDKQSVKKDGKAPDKKKEESGKVLPSTAPGQSKEVGASPEKTPRDKQSVKKEDKAPGKKKEESEKVLPSTAPGQSKEAGASPEKTTKDRQSVKKDGKAPDKKKEETDKALPSTAPDQSKEAGASTETTTKDKQSAKKEDKAADKKKEDTDKVLPSTAPDQSKEAGAITETATKDKQSVNKEDKTPDSKKEDTDKVLPSTSTAAPVQLDFKSRIRNIQMDDEELKQIIHCLENKTEVKPGYIMKAGMLCKKYQIGNNNEVRIVSSMSQLETMVYAVHTISSKHATVSKTVLLFNKHFMPIDNVDEIVETVISNCQICNQ